MKYAQDLQQKQHESLYAIKMKPTKTPLIIFGYFILGIIYFYFRDQIPLEISWDWLRVLFVISFLVSPFLLGIIIGYLIPDKFQSNKSLGCLSISIVILLLLHNLVWTIIVLWGSGGYEDKEIVYPERENPRHKIITQFKDEGAMGDRSRVIEVYEFLPFVRYVYSVKYFD